LRDIALLDRQAAIHKGLTERQLGIASNVHRNAAVVKLDRNFRAPAGPKALALAVMKNKVKPPARQQLAKEHPDQTQAPSPAHLPISLTPPEAHVATTISDAEEVVDLRASRIPGDQRQLAPNVRFGEESGHCPAANKWL
jgi:hypothetical protein